MAANRAGVMDTLHAILSGHAPLTALAPIYGNTARLDSLPVPGIIYAPGSSSTRQRGEEWEWDVGLDVFAPDVFALAAIMDAIEDACTAYRFDSGQHPLYLGLVEFLGFGELDANQAGQFSAARATIRVRWAV